MTTVPISSPRRQQWTPDVYGSSLTWMIYLHGFQGTWCSHWIPNCCARRSRVAEGDCLIVNRSPPVTLTNRCFRFPLTTCPYFRWRIIGLSRGTMSFGPILLTYGMSLMSRNSFCTCWSSFSSAQLIYITRLGGLRPFLSFAYPFVHSASSGVNKSALCAKIEVCRQWSVTIPNKLADNIVFLKFILLSSLCSFSTVVMSDGLFWHRRVFPTNKAENSLWAISFLYYTCLL